LLPVYNVKASNVLANPPYIISKVLPFDKSSVFSVWLFVTAL